MQDILFRAKLNPRQKIGNISDDDREKLLQCIRFVLLEMKKCGGRDTEKNLFGEPGGYATQMSKNSLAAGCRVCNGEIKKETYLGGSVYYCPCCQAVK